MSGVRHQLGQGRLPTGRTGAPAGDVRSLRRALDTLRAWFPRGNTLDDETFRRRHLLLCCILGLHVPALFVFGIVQGVSAGHAAVEVTAPATCLVVAHLARDHRRWAAFFVAAGLVYCSSVLVHLSYGSIEAHFHFFILIGLIALYQDWVPFLWNAVFTVVSHGIGGTLDPERMYNHPAAQNRPWVWALVHGMSVLAACIGVLVFWRSTEKAQRRAQLLATELATSELEKVQVEADRRRSMSQLMVNLARRNQSLLSRQLSLIAELEQREVQPDALAGLFQLDHMATRIRRNAESLLVLSGDEPPRRWGQPVPLPEVVRAAASEVEDYRRIEIMVDERLEVVGRAVADLAHLLAELIENATVFSPPASPVRVRSHPSDGYGQAGPAHVLSIEDTGIGMNESDRRAANEILAAVDDAGVLETRLGFHVVNRLARRYGMHVQLSETPGDTGITALVTLPGDLVGAPVRQPAAVSVGAGATLDGTNGLPTLPPTGHTGHVPTATTPRSLANASADDISALVRTAADVLSVPAALAAGQPNNEFRIPGFLLTGADGLPPPKSPRPRKPAALALPPATPWPQPGESPASAGSPKSPDLPEPEPVESRGKPSPPESAGQPDVTATSAAGPPLARRVPGASLAAARVEAAAEDEAASDQSSANSSLDNPDETTRRRARKSAMLSRFQASQRAGRAYTEAHTDNRHSDDPDDEE